MNIHSIIRVTDLSEGEKDEPIEMSFRGFVEMNDAFFAEDSEGKRNLIHDLETKGKHILGVSVSISYEIALVEG